MTIHPDDLARLATDFASGMTSIRGRRVQRLVKREFAGADRVFVVDAGAGGAGWRAVIGLSASGVACCATDGRGPQALVVRWLHDAGDAGDADSAVETGYDLLKDSLPVVASRRLPLPEAAKSALAAVPPGALGGAARQRPPISDRDATNETTLGP